MLFRFIRCVMFICCICCAMGPRFCNCPCVLAPEGPALPLFCGFALSCAACCDILRCMAELRYGMAEWLCKWRTTTDLFIDV